MFDFLEDNLLIICPNSYKIAILKYLNDYKLLFNIKFLTMNEYLKSIKFDYNEDAVHYLVSKKMKVDNAITILDNLYYIEDKDYHNEKLDYLVKIKKELDNHNLLLYDDLFSKMLNKRKIIVYGYGKLDRFSNSLFSNATIIPYKVINKKYDVYHFENIKDEVEFVFQKICDLLNKKIDINNICLMNVDSDYIPYIKIMEQFYGIKVDIDNSDVLMGTIIGKKFYDLVCDNKKDIEIINELEEFKENSEYPFITQLLNKYSNYNLIDVKEEIKYELLNRKLKKEKLNNVIKVKNVFDYVNNDEYVFLLNFNNSSIPSLKMDTDYITDDICNLVGVDNTDNNNELIKVNTLNYLSNICNITISYKDKSPFNIYSPSILLDYIDYDEKEYERSYNYSDLANKTLFTAYLDDYVKYGIKNKDMSYLSYNYGINDYLSYLNEFKGIDKNSLLKYLNNELSLSYSSLDNYYECAFKYYLSNILKLDEYEETFYTIIGNLFHYVLSKMNEKDFDIDKEYDNYLKDKKFNNKEKFFLDKLKKDLIFVIETIKKHQFITGFNNMLYEKKLDITLMNSPYVHLKGYIDKIMYEEKDDDTLVSIVDYKTGNVDVTIKNIKFGLSMQLPIYLYLIKKSNVFKNPKFTGFYLQHILDFNISKSKKTLEEEKYNRLKLSGYSTSELDRLSVYDSTYENSSMIKGLKLNKDGSISKLAKVLSDNDVDEIMKLTHEKIMEAVNNILDGKFMINPKILNGKNISCEYCHFKDICYHQDKNNIYLKDE